MNKFFSSFLVFTSLIIFVYIFTTYTFAATSPTLGGSSSYSVLGGQAVTNTGSTTTSGDVGVSTGTSITGFPPGIAAGNNATNVHSNDASAIAAQADNLIIFGALDQPCDQTFGAVDLTTTFPSGVGPGVYCSTSSFSLSGNLNLTGSGVWIFKTVSTLITSPGSSVTGGDPCNVWWRVGSSVTLGTTTSFIGNILALNGVNALNTGATLNGRLLVQTAGTVTLDGNTIYGPNCVTSPTPSPTPSPSASPSPSPLESPSSSPTPTSTPTPTTTPEATATPSSTPTPTETATSTTSTNNETSQSESNNSESNNTSGTTVTNTRVLGSTTMAKTGGFEEGVSQAIITLGATLSAFGIKGLKKGKKVSKKA